MTNPITNYLVRHWRGEFSLAVSFWVNLLVPWSLFAMSNDLYRLLFGSEAVKEAHEQERIFGGAEILHYIFGIFFVTILVWQVVGCLRAAVAHVYGRRGWVAPTIIIIFLCFGALNTWSIYDRESKPYAAASPQREEFVRQYVSECVRTAAGWPRDQSQKTCTCLADELADTVTRGEFRARHETEQSAAADISAANPNSLREKIASLREKCI